MTQCSDCCGEPVSFNSDYWSKFTQPPQKPTPVYYCVTLCLKTEVLSCWDPGPVLMQLLTWYPYRIGRVHGVIGGGVLYSTTVIVALHNFRLFDIEYSYSERRKLHFNVVFYFITLHVEYLYSVLHCSTGINKKKRLDIPTSRNFSLAISNPYLKIMFGMFDSNPACVFLLKTVLNLFAIFAG